MVAAAEHGWSVGEEIRVEFARTGEQSMTVAGAYEHDEFLGSYVVSLETFERNVTDRLVSQVLATGLSRRSRTRRFMAISLLAWAVLIGWPAIPSADAALRQDPRSPAMFHFPRLPMTPTATSRRRGAVRPG